MSPCLCVDDLPDGLKRGCVDVVTWRLEMPAPSTTAVCFVGITCERPGLLRQARPTMRLATRLGHVEAAVIDLAERADHQIERLIAVLTDELEALRTGREADVPVRLPRRGVGAGIVDRHLVLDGVEI